MLPKIIRHLGAAPRRLVQSPIAVVRVEEYHSHLRAAAKCSFRRQRLRDPATGQRPSCPASVPSLSTTPGCTLAKFRRSSSFTMISVMHVFVWGAEKCRLFDCERETRWRLLQLRTQCRCRATHQAIPIRISTLSVFA